MSVRFREVEYMKWAKTVPMKFKYSLAMSGIDLLATPDELAFTGADITATGWNVYGYAPLKEQISAMFGVAEKNIIITQGTSLANFLIAAALVNEGDEVIVEMPAYEPLLSIFEPLGAQVKRLPRRFENQFVIDPDELASLLTTRTKLVLITTLHNPSGVQITSAQLREIARVAARVGATVVVDEVYQDFLGANIPPGFLQTENIVTTSSLTKVYGFGGLRVGWVMAPEEVVKRCYEVNNNLGVNNSIASDHLAARLLERGIPQLVAQRARERSAAGWKITKEWFATRRDVEVVAPDGGLTCFPRLVANHSSEKLNTLLQTKYETNFVPGRFFEDDRSFRLGFGAPDDMLREALRRLGAGLDDFCGATLR